MVVTCTVHPFERRVIATIGKVGSTKDRALVRVAYQILQTAEPAIEVIEHAFENQAAELRDLRLASDARYGPNYLQKTAAHLSSNHGQVIRACMDLNQHFVQHGDGVWWVDADFPLQAPSVSTSNTQSPPTLPLSMLSWLHVHSMIDNVAWLMISCTTDKGKDSIDVGPLVSGMPGHESYCCALSVVSGDSNQWLHRWFPLWGSVTADMVAWPVRLWSGGIGRITLLVDLFLPGFPLGTSVASPRTGNGELWPAVLHKAHAKLKGGYAPLAELSTIDIVRELTGVPWYVVLLLDCVIFKSRSSLFLWSSVCLFNAFNREPSSADVAALEKRLERIFERVRCSTRRSMQPTIIVSFANTRQLGFLATGCSSSPTRSIVLRDAGGRLRRVVLESGDLETDEDVAVPWSSFFSLRPSVWAMLPSLCCSRRVRRRLLRYQDRTDSDNHASMEFSVAFSVASLSTAVLTGHLSAPSLLSGSCNCHSSPPRLDLRLYTVAPDDSCAPCEASNEEQDSQPFGSSLDQISVQVRRCSARPCRSSACIEYHWFVVRFRLFGLWHLANTSSPSRRRM